MSLRESFAKIAKKIGVPAPFSLAGDLLRAVDANNGAQVTKLLELDPDVLKTENGQLGRTLLSRAVSWKNASSAKALAAFAPTLLTDGDSEGATLLMNEARTPSSVDSFNLLLSLYTVETAQGTDKKGNNVMHYAAGKEGNNAFTLEQLGKVVPVLATAVNADGETPLMEAGRTGAPAGAILLIRMGSPLAATNNDGQNATMIAIRHSNLKTASSLMKHGGFVDFNDSHIDTQMRVATVEMELDFLETLQQRRDTQAKQKQKENDAISAAVAAEIAARPQRIVQAVTSGMEKDVDAPVRAKFQKRKNPGAEI